MRINEAAGIYMQHEDISPEAYKAQRMAELEQIARYRAKRLAQFQAWADPVQRAQIKANMAAEEQEARQCVEGSTVWLPPLKRLEDRVTIKKLHKPVKKSWFRRCRDALVQAFMDVLQI